MKKFLKFVSLGVCAALCCAFCLGCGSKSRVKVIEIALTEEQYAIGVKKGNTTLLNDINKVLNDILEDGTFQEIYTKYNTKDESEIEGIAIPTSSAGLTNPLILATSPDFPPFENVKGDKFVGIDIEIAQIIADRLERPLVIHSVAFKAVVTSVQTDKADFAMAGLTVNDERKEAIDFSVSYIDATQYLMVKADDTTFDDAKTAQELIDIINSKKGFRVGAQEGTTGHLFAVGDENMGYDGFPDAVFSPFPSGALAVQDMLNGGLDAVILDKLPAMKIAKQF